MEHTLLDWLARFGPSVLFFAQIFGIFGIPVPDELLLTLAGVLVRHGELNGPVTLLATYAGCGGGVTFSFVLGRTAGAAALRHRVLRSSGAGLNRAERWFKRFGLWLLAFSYFVPGVRHVSAITAGAASLDTEGSHWRRIPAPCCGAVSTSASATSPAIAGRQSWRCCRDVRPPSPSPPPRPL